MIGATHVGRRFICNTAGLQHMCTCIKHVHVAVFLFCQFPTIVTEITLHYTQFKGDSNLTNLLSWDRCGT